MFYNKSVISACQNNTIRPFYSCCFYRFHSIHHLSGLRYFDLSYNPVGANLSIGRDGTPEFNMEGQTADVELKYNAMQNADYDLVLAMWVSDESTVRVYPDPVTNPNTYETMIMIRVKLPGSTNNYKLTRSGVEGVVLPFKRKFEL